MAGLGSGWWSGGGIASIWDDDWTGYFYNWLNFSGTGPWILLLIGTVKCFQKPYTSETAGGNAGIEPGWDTGYFFMTQSTDGSGTRFNSATAGIGGDSLIDGHQPQWTELGNGLYSGLVKGDLSPAGDSRVDRCAFYKTGFVYDAGAPNLKFLSAYADVQAMMPMPTAGTWYLHHYRPWAWTGTVPEVIASILMHCGLSADDINQATFDNAHDAYDPATGDLPFTSAGGTIHGVAWAGMDRSLKVYCSRRIGETCVSMLKELVRHTRDYYYVNEAGEFCINSYTRPNYVEVGLSLNDGVIGGIDRKVTLKYTYNRAHHTWGSGFRCYGNMEAIPAQSDYSAAEEEGLESYRGDKLSAERTDATSIAQYGELFMKGVRRKINLSGNPREIEAAHYPLIFNSGAKSLTAGIPTATAWIGSDSQSRRVIEFKQDMRALDWGVGDEVQDVALTGDGDTIAVTRCIEREYDFDNLTIRSVLLEIPQ